MLKKIPLILICLFFILSIASALNKSAVIDELAHIAAGLTYATKHTLRFNPEHPPLIKNLAAFPLVALKVQLPPDYGYLTQYNLGGKILYESHISADKILFSARLPLIIMSVLFAALFYVLIKKYFNQKIALLALFLFALSPDIIAFSHYVVTDLPAAIFIFLTIFYFSRFLADSSLKNSLLSGIFFGTALSVKFSAITIIPLIVFGFLFSLKNKIKKDAEVKNQHLVYIWRFLLLVIIALLIINFVYFFSGYNDFFKSQQSMFNFTLNNYYNGLNKVLTHVYDGHDYPQYLFGSYINDGSWAYFPLAFIVKTPLPLLILILIAAIGPFLIKGRLDIKQKIKNFLEKPTFVQIFIFNSLLFLIIYIAASLKSKLNIGIRHLLPIFPFIYLLISIAITKIWSQIKFNQKKKFNLIIAFLLSWYLILTLIAFPNYLSYFNEIAAYGKYGEFYLNDSNLDWGQDLIYLANWVKKNNVAEIYVDYYGGGNPKYYLQDSFIPWHIDYGLPQKGLLAVSKFYIMTSIYNKSINKSKFSYEPLRSQKPIKRIGNSILIYELK